jgi:vanillate O-demethylase monooxygenase subunit
MSVEFIRNGWYATAWSHEVARDPIERWVTGLPLVFYRKQNGDLVVLDGTCPHRAAPMALGRVRGDEIACGYHGIAFNCEGACTEIPGQARISSVMHLRAYPTLERGGLIWVWPGDADKADPKLCPDRWLEEPGYKWVHNTRTVHARLSLIVDNLMDLTHESYLHTDSIGDDHVHSAPLAVTAAVDHVSAKRVMVDIDPVPLFANLGGLKGRIDRSQTAEHWPPSVCLTIAAGAPTGTGNQTFKLTVMHCLTPETANRTRYSLIAIREAHLGQTTGLGDAALDEMFRASGSRVLDQDIAMLEAVEVRLQNQPNAVEVSAACDAGGLAARKLVASYREAEAA